MLQTTRHRAGALLGWVFHKFDKKPLAWPLKNETEISKKSHLYQHVRSIAFMLEDFAINYLAGETEWALERSWRPCDDATSYMREHFHHSGGWICKDAKLEKLEMKDGYFEWDAGKRILKVDLSRKIPIGRTNQSPPISLVAYLEPNSLCLHPAEEFERTYHSYVAEKARQFYDRCLAIAEQRKQAERQGWQSGIREDREIHEFMWAHETRKLSRALVQCDQPVVRDLIGRHLVAMTYPARGEPDRLSEDNDLKQYWPPPYSVLCGPAKDWMWAIHDYSARRWALTRYALEAATHGSCLEEKLDEFCESSRKDVQWNEMWDELMIDDTFPGAARKFFTRLWLAAFSNYFKHRETQTARPPCLLDIRESNVTGILLISQSNLLGKAPSDSGKELGTKDILNYDLLNAARWRGKSQVSVFGPIQEQNLIGMVRFEVLSAPPLEAETRFVTQVPIPRTFFI